MDASFVSTERLVTRLADPALTASLSHFVRGRVPDTAVEDIVQSTLTEALDADQPPGDDEEIIRWVHGICRHKIVDWFRKTRREVPRDLEAGETGEGGAIAVADSAPQGAMDLLRWAEKELPEGEENAKTLEWMLREGQGEKLESIAAEANLPAPRVRQRVSRLRRYYKARWAAQAAAFAALLLIALAIVLALRQRRDQVAPAPGPSLAPSMVPPPPPTAPESLPRESPAFSTQPQDSLAAAGPYIPSLRPDSRAAGSDGHAHVARGSRRPMPKSKDVLGRARFPSMTGSPSGAPRSPAPRRRAPRTGLPHDPEQEVVARLSRSALLGR